MRTAAALLISFSLIYPILSIAGDRAEANLEAGWLAAGRVPIGCFVRWSYIPWDAHREKSLTLDYFGGKGISYFNLGISVGYLFF